MATSAIVMYIRHFVFLATLLGPLGSLVSSAPPTSSPWKGLPPECSHVVVLDGENDRKRARRLIFEDQVQLTRPGRQQLAAAEAALERMTPLLCQSVGRMAFGYVPQHADRLAAVNSFGAGDMMLINLSNEVHSEEQLAAMLNRRLLLQGTIIHEAGHTAETLLTVEGRGRTQGYGGDWSSSARRLARQTIERTRLEKGLPEEWRRLHKGFVALGLAAAYPSEETVESWSRQEVATAGFMTRGGAHNWAEDIATFVASPYIGPEFTAGLEGQGRLDLRTDLGCEAMQAHGEPSVPVTLAAVYTKLLFLRDLGMVTREGVDWCTGSHLGLAIEEEGFHFEPGSTDGFRIGDHLEAGVSGRRGGRKLFELRAEGSVTYEGESYPATVVLRLDLGGRFDALEETSWPRGIYRIDQSSNVLQLRIDGAPAGDLDAEEGFVLVTEASSERIAGSISLSRTLYPNAPHSASRSLDPPLTIRFLIEN